MGIISKTVKVIPHGKSVKHYREKGYDVKSGLELEVKVEDLMMSSTVLVDTKCDYCGKQKYPIRYVDYNAQTKNGTYKCCCLDCAKFKREERMIEKYGHQSALQVPEIKQKFKETNQERYGSNSPSGNVEVRKKQKQTLMKNYGVDNPSLSKEIREKRKQTFVEKFGVENPLLNQEIREKAINTIIERYGVENVLLNKEIREKREEILLEKYGTIYPLQNDECFDKLKQTNIDKYGVEFVSQLEEIKYKVKQTNLERCGYESYMQSPEFLEKWLSKNSTNFIKSSNQQQYLCNLYKGILNYAFKCFALDIYIKDDNIDVEYDGSGHLMSISFGITSAENFEKKELYRNVAIKRAGIKQMRIISTKDLLPSDTTLLKMLQDARNYFSETNHTWCTYDIDSSLLFNAEYKEGIMYNYGELRKIKDEDLKVTEPKEDEVA